MVKVVIFKGVGAVFVGGVLAVNDRGQRKLFQLFVDVCKGRSAETYAPLLVDIQGKMPVFQLVNGIFHILCLMEFLGGNVGRV